MKNTILETNFATLKLLKRGKVRDIYDLDDQLLMVATDRLSAFDVVMPDPIPDKGKVLTQISLFWFGIMETLIPNHVIASDPKNFPSVCQPYAEQLRDRSMLVKKATPLPIECVVRGYISGSGWNDYQSFGSVCGIKLPKGLAESERLPEPIFTPSTKADMGHHDINIDAEAAIQLIGKNRFESVKSLSIQIYQKGAEFAAKKGIIIADTKFEFGLIGNDLILIDEILTPDSSRFWPKASYRAGGPQKSFDKQYVRDYLISINYNKKPPGPSLPENVIAHTRNKYLEAFNQLTAPDHAI
ncbi:MAG: phosphoribosylaminoimidazolesuccinocarboxamide synthase [Desulfobacterales bacterium]|nr:MAG: phosphoribosylaminoimidazolesuccinocarboxamide synthase [Desulfobacterales bacterium]UCD91534.1 MAG: phosphoribosylaminoimidazolesuccinocarboxamide synthase [Desulfobacterales bacterium]